LLSDSTEASTISRLEAIEEWSRSLAGVLTTGVGLEQALLVSAQSAPGPIAPEVNRLAARLKARWSTEAALYGLASDLADTTGDLVSAQLILSARRRGSGLARSLEILSQSVAADIRTRRQVEADRAKPRATAKWVTLITVIVLAVLFFSGQYIDPYRTSVGQIAFIALVAAYAGVLVWMKRLTRGVPAIRLIGEHARSREPGADD
jgi:Flp pilus assembly protein TadB